MRSPAKRAFPELSKMRDERLIKGRAVGVNTPMAIHKVMDDADPDVCLCARRYSLIDHAETIDNLFTAVRERGVMPVLLAAAGATSKARRIIKSHRRSSKSGQSSEISRNATASICGLLPSSSPQPRTSRLRLSSVPAATARPARIGMR